MTGGRDDEGDAPAIKVTDKRRFAGLSEVQGAAEEAALNAEEAPSADGQVADAEQTRELREHLQRLQAEFDNYRKRVLREQTAAVEMASEPVMRRLLEVLDDFELALMHAADDVDPERLLKGVELVYAKLLDALSAEGLQRIPAEGARFDPEMHEALMQTGEGEGEPHVAEVFRQGYTLRGRVVRPAGVRVERE
ncbi:MAG: nucleotide exchange factor GrpE [Actinomycetota bacterium]